MFLRPDVQEEPLKTHPELFREEQGGGEDGLQKAAAGSACVWPGPHHRTVSLCKYRNQPEPP